MDLTRFTLAALRNSTNDFILNGNFVITAFHKYINLKGSKLEYSGSNTAVERINGTQMIHEDLQVLVSYDRLISQISLRVFAL